VFVTHQVGYCLTALVTLVSSSSHHTNYSTSALSNWKKDYPRISDGKIVLKTTNRMHLGHIL